MQVDTGFRFYVTIMVILNQSLDVWVVIADRASDVQPHPGIEV